MWEQVALKVVVVEEGGRIKRVAVGKTAQVRTKQVFVWVTHNDLSGRSTATCVGATQWICVAARQ